MSGSEKSVATSDALVAATKDKNVQQIVVSGHLTNAPTVRLSPGQALRGAGKSATITFTNGADGVQLTSSNLIDGLRLEAAPDRRAVFNDTTVASLGRIEMRNLRRPAVFKFSPAIKLLADTSTLMVSISLKPMREERLSVRTAMGFMFSMVHSPFGTCKRTKES